MVPFPHFPSIYLNALITLTPLISSLSKALDWLFLMDLALLLSALTFVAFRSGSYKTGRIIGAVFGVGFVIAFSLPQIVFWVI